MWKSSPLFLANHIYFKKKFKNNFAEIRVIQARIKAFTFFFHAVMNFISTTLFNAALSEVCCQNKSMCSWGHGWAWRSGLERPSPLPNPPPCRASCPSSRGLPQAARAERPVKGPFTLRWRGHLTYPHFSWPLQSLHFKCQPRSSRLWVRRGHEKDEKTSFLCIRAAKSVSWTRKWKQPLCSTYRSLLLSIASVSLSKTWYHACLLLAI